MFQIEKTDIKQKHTEVLAKFGTWFYDVMDEFLLFQLLKVKVCVCV